MRLPVNGLAIRLLLLLQMGLWLSLTTHGWGSLELLLSESALQVLLRHLVLTQKVDADFVFVHLLAADNACLGVHGDVHGNVTWSEVLL